NDGTEEVGLKKVNGKYYYFDPEMITDTQNLINDVPYYFDKNGEGTSSSTN
ncbi:hypothetical protein ACLOEH_09135, partial [Limosilactobacillus mucosae]|uniref:hypothetical protein n=1 Tax=Limosilactobacillus mucosae TaxID=97478 RepID=UPI003EBEA462